MHPHTVARMPAKNFLRSHAVIRRFPRALGGGTSRVVPCNTSRRERGPGPNAASKVEDQMGQSSATLLSAECWSRFAWAGDG